LSLRIEKNATGPYPHGPDFSYEHVIIPDNAEPIWKIGAKETLFSMKSNQGGHHMKRVSLIPCLVVLTLLPLGVFAGDLDPTKGITAI
jgi:hypothetical protein